MSELKFDETGERYFENGVDHGILFAMNNTSDYIAATPTTHETEQVEGTYPNWPAHKYYTKSGDEYTLASTYESSATYYVATGKYEKGVEWNGLISVSESPEGAEVEDFYADNMKYGSIQSAETFNATINAYYYPDEFAPCDGMIVKNGIVLGQQTRIPFAFAYRTNVGNDQNQEAGHILHIVYGAKATPSEREHSTVNDSPEMEEMSWEVNTTPIRTSLTVDGATPKPIAHIQIKELDSKTIYDAVEAILLGSNSTDSRLPLPDELIDLMNKTISNNQ